MPSISTGIPNGSAPIPIAERAWRPRSAEDLDEEVGRAVRDRRLLPEIRVGVDEHEQLDHALHTVELADLLLQAREQVHDRERGGRLPGRDVDLAAELALVDELAVAVRAVARDEDNAADA